MHAGCNLGVHDMNNTILMVWSGGLGWAGLCRQFCSLIKRNVFAFGPGEAAGYRYQISFSRSPKQTGVGDRMQLEMLQLRPFLIKHKYLLYEAVLGLPVKSDFHTASIGIVSCSCRRSFFNPAWVYSRPEKLDCSNTTLNHINMRPFFTQL